MNLKSAEKVIIAKAKLYQIVQLACKELLHTHLLAEPARQYLQKRISLENQDTFDLGYFPDDENLDILFNKISENNLSKLGLIYPYHVQNGDHRVYINKSILSKHNIIMPYRDIYGNIKALIGRTFLSEIDRKAQKLQKYKYTRFSKSLYLFGLYQAKQSILQHNSVILVEGQIDCISCHQFGIHNVVALGGCILTKRQFQLLTRFTDQIYLLLDNDIEGKKAQDKIIKQYGRFATIKSLTLPDPYKDVDEYLHDNHTEAISLIYNK